MGDIGRTCTLVFLLFACVCLKPVITADPALSWSTWSDAAGNSADANSDVTFAPIPLPANTSYKGGNIEYDSKGLEPLYNFAKAFINGAVFPYGISWDLIDKFINGTLIQDVTENYLDYVKEYAGYGALIVIGFLFMFLFPLIGCCFCCCRCCCNNCGGKMVQNQKDADNNCKRRTFAVILLVLIAFIAAGMICVYISNDQMSDVIDTFDTSAANSLDDINTFIDIFVYQLKHVAQTNFNFTRDVIYRDLDSIGYIVGIPVRTTLKTTGGVDAAVSSANVLVDKVDVIADAILALNTSLTYVKSNATALETAANTLKTNIENDKTSCGTTCDELDVAGLAVGVDQNAFPDLKDQVDKIQSVQAQNLTAVIETAKQSVEDVPWRVQNETAQVISDIKNTVGNLSEQIQPIIAEAEKFQGDTTGSFNVGKYKDMIRNYTRYGVDYDKYRWYGGIGLTSIILLIVLLLLIGLMFAVCGHSADAAPTERSGLSSCGGHMFMAAVGFVFIFSSLLMLLTTLVFIIGTPTHRFLCEPITDPELTDLQKMMDEVVYRTMYGGTGSLLGRMILNNASHPLTLKKILGACELGKSAYSALELQSLIDISALTNYSGTFDVDSQVDNINVDLSTLSILTPDLTNQLEDLRSSSDVNFTAFREQLSQNSLNINLTELSTNLTALATTLSGTANQTNFNARATDTDNLQNQELADFNSAMDDLESKLNAVETAVNGTSDTVDTTLNAFNVTEIFIQTNGTQMIKDEAKIFAKRLIKIVDYLVNDTLYGLENEIGACYPIWYLYDDIFVTSFCKYLIDTLNGFWFGLGWCIFFFVPSIIFATKLAKHYRKMKTHDFHDRHDKGGIPLPEVNSQAPPDYYSNDQYSLINNEREARRTNRGMVGFFNRHSSSPGFKNNKVRHSEPKSGLSGW